MPNYPSRPLRAVAAALLFSGSAAPLMAQAPVLGPTSSPVAGDRWQLSITLFRNPGTGLELRRGALMVFAGHYPTIIRRDDWTGDDRPTTHFIRVGAGVALRAAHATSPYLTLSFAGTSASAWSNSWLVDTGVRQRLGRTGWAHRATGRLGVGWLRAPDRRANRVNPTVGLGWEL